MSRSCRVALLVTGLLSWGCGDGGHDAPRPATPTAGVTATSAPTSTPPTVTTPVPTATPTPLRPSPAATARATPSAIPTSAPTTLRGRVTDASGQPLSGVMLTASDDARKASVSVFSGADGRYDFPPIPSGPYRLRAHRIGWRDAVIDSLQVDDDGALADLTLAVTDDLDAQLPPTYFKALLRWPSARVAGDFARACANCHQIGDFRWREGRTRQQWEELINRMIGYGGIPFFPETRAVLLDTIASTFAPDAPPPHFDVPPPPAGETLRAVIREWEIDPARTPGCHDLELGRDGTVYTVGGLYALNPTTGERAYYPLAGGGHSIERDADGNMWITAPGPEQLIKFDVTTKQFTRYDQPRIGDDLGSYPHTLHFDAMGRIWYTLTRSNHVCMFDPATAQFTYYRLPPADPAISGVPIPVAYGCDVAPDQTVWWSQLFGHMIGRIDPASGSVAAWRPPFDGPRRLEVGPDNVVWVPGYGSGELGGFDPATETWRVYKLPTEPQGEDLPYNVGVNKHNGDVWITGSNSDTLIRFRPDTETFTVFPLPTRSDFTREIEFDESGAAWTCTSDQEIVDDVPGTGRIIKVEVRARVGSCGDGVLQLGEACDDGNPVDCDGCSAACVLEGGCGDGVRCGAEACDDGNARDCDGCSGACVLEPGAACGDGVVSQRCGEECEPPDERCTTACRRAPVCGDGAMAGAEACDDGNAVDCDGCSAACQIETGCGDGARCGVEACDDGNRLDCDGCSAACTVEVGAVCGDGIVNEACGEQCDPPGDGCSVICTAGAGILGTRTLTFGGAFYSSALGTAVPLGELLGILDLVGGRLDAQGVAPVTVDGPVTYSSAILGGQFGTLCVRIESCTGFIDCDGGTAVATLMVQDSNGSGRGGLPVTIATGQGDPGPPGALQLDCRQSFVQLAAAQGSDCAVATYPDPQRTVYTTGEAVAYFFNGAPKVGSGAISVAGEPFLCSNWAGTDGPGKLAGTFLVEEDPRAGDVAQATLIDD